VAFDALTANFKLFPEPELCFHSGWCQGENGVCSENGTRPPTVMLLGLRSQAPPVPAVKETLNKFSDIHNGSS